MAEASGPGWRASPAIRVSAGVHGTALGLLALHPAWWPALAAVLAANHVVLTAIGMWPQSQAFGETLYRLPGISQHVALTFDDGPDPEVTPYVLDTLDAWGATASFFCIGERARANPGLVRRIVAAGHGVENHSLTHPNSFACHGPRGLHREVIGAQRILEDITGRTPAWFRAPMGFRSPLLQPLLCRAGLRQAAWTRRGFDTSCRDPAVILRRLMRNLAGGDVLLMHDGNAARSIDSELVLARVLPGVLAALANHGLNAAALPDATAGLAPLSRSPPSAAYASR